MAKSTSKTILFATTRFDKKVFNHPVAVFNTPSDAKTYATYLKLAYRAQDFDAIKALDPKAHVDSEGVPVPDAKLSLMEVPYAPVPLLDDDDTVEGDPAAS